MITLFIQLVMLVVLASVAATDCGRFFRPVDRALKKGEAATAKGDWDSAIGHYSEAVRIDPSNPVGHNNLGFAIMNAGGRNDEAMAHFRKALEIEPNYADAHNNLGVVLAAKGQLTDATAHFRKALEIKPNYVDAHNNLGAALFATDRFEEAMAHCCKALEIKPNNADAHSNLGNALAASGRLDEAIKHYHKALEIKPDHANAHGNLGVILEDKGRLTEAIAHFRKALEIHPEHVEFLNNLAWLLATCPEDKVRDGAEAVKLAEKADRLCGGKRADVLDTLAAAQAEAGRFPEAIANAQKALKLATQKKDQAFSGRLRGRIALYKTEKPFRQAPPGSATTPSKP